MPLEDITARILAALCDGTSQASDIQYRLSPRLADGSLMPRLPGERQAAALLLLFSRNGRPCVVLTLRAPHLPHHADQVSLPGGRIEPGETPEGAALREAEEEIGLSPASVRVIGRLSPVFIPVSGFTLHVVLGITTEVPAFAPHAGEVAQVIEVPLDELMDSTRLKRGTWTREGRVLDVPFFDVAGVQVWGATAMALAEFLSLCGYAPDPWADGH